MSGGSYNYACYVLDIGDVISKRSDIEGLCERLEGIKYATKPAKDLRRVLQKIDTLNRETETNLRKLQNVMHGLEWWDSCDWSEERFKEEVMEYINAAPNPK